MTLKVLHYWGAVSGFQQSASRRFIDSLQVARLTEGGQTLVRFGASIEEKAGPMVQTTHPNRDLEEAEAYLAAIVKKEYRRRGWATGGRADLTICWASFVAQERPWMLSATLTFRKRQVSVHDAIGHLHQWFADLGKTLRLGFDYVFFVEPQFDGNAHLDGLIVSDRELTSVEVNSMRALWHDRHGFEKFVRLRSQISRYRAAGYAMKSYGHAEPENLVLSRGLRHLIRKSRYRPRDSTSPNQRS